MKTIHIGSQPQVMEDDLCLAVGYFDGLHLGHLQLLKEVKRQADNKHLKSAVLSFSPNPLLTLGVIEEEHLITSLKDRAEILESLGFDYFLILDFSPAIAAMECEAFIEEFIVKMNVKHVVCGFDFYFGKQGRGNSQTLQDLSLGRYAVSVIAEYEDHHLKVSSSRISQLIQKGDMEEAHRLLSRPFRISGTVIHGKKRGHDLGFPTANISYSGYVLPAFGVYGVYLEVAGQKIMGMANVGINPTFGDLKLPSIEVNLFDFHEDIYDQPVKVSFYFYERGDVTFENVGQLVRQLHKDRESIIKKFKDIQK